MFKNLLFKPYTRLVSSRYISSVPVKPLSKRPVSFSNEELQPYFSKSKLILQSKINVHPYNIREFSRLDALIDEAIHIDEADAQKTETLLEIKRSLSDRFKNYEINVDREYYGKANYIWIDSKYRSEWLNELLKVWKFELVYDFNQKDGASLQIKVLTKTWHAD